MGFFAWLKQIFGGSANVEKSTVSANTTQNKMSQGVRLGNSELFFHEELIGSLKADHQFLLDAYTNIDKARNDKNYGGVTKNLESFIKRLERHLLTENTLLYVYLVEALKTNESSLDAVKKMKQDMNKIGHAVLSFSDKYQNIKEWNANVLQELQKDMEGLTPVLVKRIQTEESFLYPLYKHPDHY